MALTDGGLTRCPFGVRSADQPEDRAAPSTSVGIREIRVHSPGPYFFAREARRFTGFRAVRSGFSGIT
jgi:hypothetical protein